jgi:hypothetical protein
MDISKFIKPAFEINTKNHGLIKFSSFQSWRHDLINKEITDPKKEDAKKVVCIIAKYNIYEINNMKFTDREKSEGLTNINLELTNNELEEFSKIFLDQNKYLLGLNDPDLKIYNGDGKELKLEEDKELLKHKWPEDPIERLKEAWIIEMEKQKKWIKDVLGLSGIVNLEGISSVIKKQQEMYSSFIKNDLSIPKPYFSVDNNFQNSFKEMQLIENKQRDERIKINNAISETPELLRDLIKLQANIYETNSELQRKANSYLDEQLKESKKNTESARSQSLIAIIIAAISILISGSLSFYQIQIAKNPNKQLEDIFKEIKNGNDLIYDINSKIIDASNDNKQKDIINVLNDINKELKNKK